MRYGSNPPVASLLYFGGMQHNLRAPHGQDFVCFNTQGSGWTHFSTLRSSFYGGGRAAWTAGDLKVAGNLGDGRGGTIWTATAAAHNRTSGARLPAADTPLESRLYSEIMINANAGLVGKIPGLLVASHRLDSDTNGAIVTVEGSPHNWLYTAQLDVVSHGGGGIGCGLLVNTGQWTY